MMKNPIPLAVRSFEIEWLRPDGSVDYVERASVRQTAPGRWLVRHEVRGEEVYREVYALSPKGDEQTGDETEALEDLNCLYREFWEHVASGGARLSEGTETANRTVLSTARIGLRQRGPEIERVSGFCPVRVRPYRRRQ